LAEKQKLNRAAQKLLTNESEGLYLSAISSWEITIKFALGRLKLPESPEQYIPYWLRQWGLRALDVTHAHALAVGSLPGIHQDPFDRILVAQAQSEEMILLTADRTLQKYSVTSIWCGV
jgi:PIN domain nuclease of toxin-antitoxin system